EQLHTNAPGAVSRLATSQMGEPLRAIGCALTSERTNAAANASTANFEIAIPVRHIERQPAAVNRTRPGRLVAILPCANAARETIAILFRVSGLLET